VVVEVGPGESVLAGELVGAAGDRPALPVRSVCALLEALRCLPVAPWCRPWSRRWLTTRPVPADVVLEAGPSATVVSELAGDEAGSVVEVASAAAGVRLADRLAGGRAVSRCSWRRGRGGRVGGRLANVGGGGRLAVVTGSDGATSPAVTPEAPAVTPEAPVADVTCVTVGRLSLLGRLEPPRCVAKKARRTSTTIATAPPAITPRASARRERRGYLGRSLLSRRTRRRNDGIHAE
jgi:hypothetical protein